MWLLSFWVCVQLSECVGESSNPNRRPRTSSKTIPAYGSSLAFAVTLMLVGTSALNALWDFLMHLVLTPTASSLPYAPACASHHHSCMLSPTASGGRGLCQCPLRRSFEGSDVCVCVCVCSSKKKTQHRVSVADETKHVQRPHLTHVPYFRTQRCL